MTILEIFLHGALFAAAWLLLVRTLGRRHPIWWHAAMLFIAALAYLGFAAVAGDRAGVAVELAGTLAFGSLAVAAGRAQSMRLLAIGWALHPLWDLALHPGALTLGAMGGYAHMRYVLACMSFDWVVAWILMRQSVPVPVRLEQAA